MRARLIRAHPYTRVCTRERTRAHDKTRQTLQRQAHLHYSKTCCFRPGKQVPRIPPRTHCRLMVGWCAGVLSHFVGNAAQSPRQEHDHSPTIPPRFYPWWSRGDRWPWSELHFENVSNIAEGITLLVELCGNEMEKGTRRAAGERIATF